MATPSSPAVFLELAALAEHLNDLQQILDGAANIGPCASLYTLSKRVAVATGINELVIHRIINAVFNLRNVLDQSGQSRPSDVRLAEFFKRVQSTAVPDWSDAHFSQLESNVSDLAATIEQLDEDHPVFVSTKARDLGYSHDNLLVSTRIITDARPVFDKESTKILATVIGQSLCIQYTDGLNAQRSITFALDSDDIESLRSGCERAIQKAKILIREMADFNPSVLPGN